MGTGRDREIGTETQINLEGKTVERGKQRGRNGKRERYIYIYRERESMCV